MNDLFLEFLREEIVRTKKSNAYKIERQLFSPQGTHITVDKARKVLNFCSNNYLGLANHREVKNAAKQNIETWGYGLASVRFICGTQSIHKQLEEKISAFLQTEDTLLYSSCFDANTGLFETILEAEDAVISDELNHASLIDGIRLCKAKRWRYKNNDMLDLESKLKEASSSRFRLIATDGVFSMDGSVANLGAICELANKYRALIMVDDSHAVGVIGPNGRGTPAYSGVSGKVDIYTGTFGKALGGASGGYTSGRKEIIDWLRQRSRPYLFSNSLAPCIAATTLTTIDMILADPKPRERLMENTRIFREKLTALGFSIIPGQHPIIPLLLGDTGLSKKFAEEMLEQNIYVTSFCYPVVPEGKARIRIQISAEHSLEDLEEALRACSKIGKKLGVIS